ncbi:MAG: hypothetical protein QXG65_00650 [Thermoplasmata archaeon]
MPSRRPFLHYALSRLALLPAQLLLILWLLYVGLEVPSSAHRLSGTAFFTGFAAMVFRIVTGQWGAPSVRFGVPVQGYFQQFLDGFPTSLQVALFALPISAAGGYYLALATGWRPRAGSDLPSRLVTLGTSYVGVIVLAFLVESALFLAYVAIFRDIVGFGLIPTATWWMTYGGGFPPWVIDTGPLLYTTPTRIPIVDGFLHGAWLFEAATAMKTLIQGVAIAVVYLAAFLRPARSIVADESRSVHIWAARARGIPEGRLHWGHAARRLRAPFWLLFALTIPGYLATQFAVEALFGDPGIGTFAISTLSSGVALPAVEGLIFAIALLVLVSVYATDLLAARADPRGTPAA